MWKYIQPQVHLAKATGNQAILLKLLADFVEQNEAQPIQILCRMWKDQSLVLTYEQIRSWISNGDVSEDDMKLWRADYMKALSEKMKPLWEKTASAPVVPDNPNFKWISNTTWEYRPQEAGMDRWMRDHLAKQVTKITDQQRDAIKDILAWGKKNKVGADELARYLRPVIGLNSPQAKANANYYSRVKADLEQNHPRMKPENIEKKARQKARMYAEKQHRTRAQTIIRSEMSDIYNQGAYSAVEQAQQDGYLGEMYKRWVCARTGKVCAACAALDGVTLKMEESFVSGKFGKHDGPRLHPRCMCVLEFLTKEEVENK